MLASQQSSDTRFHWAMLVLWYVMWNAAFVMHQILPFHLPSCQYDLARLPKALWLQFCISVQLISQTFAGCTKPWSKNGEEPCDLVFTYKVGCAENSFKYVGNIWEWKLNLPKHRFAVFSCRIVFLLKSNSRSITGWEASGSNGKQQGEGGGGSTNFLFHMVHLVFKVDHLFMWMQRDQFLKRWEIPFPPSYLVCP